MQLNWRDIWRFADLQKALNYSLEEMETLTNTYLTQLVYTRQELLEMFEMERDDFVENLLTANTRQSEVFKLRQRALHVFQGNVIIFFLSLTQSTVFFPESIRVKTFVEVAQSPTDGTIHLMKKLMRQSHESLRSLYECSHPNLDQLVELSDKLGVGARLTGAG